MPRPVRLFFSLAVCVILAVTAPVDGAHHEEGQSKEAQSSPSPAGSNPKTSKIQGTVFNGTSKLPAPEGLEVRLVVIDGSNVRPLGVARTDASGNFVFPDVKSLETKNGHLLAMTEYEKVPYFALVKAGGKPARLFVYDLTQDPSGIVVESHQLLGRYEEGRLLFREVVRLANKGKATFAPDGTETLSFQLPEGAELLQAPSGMNPRGVQMSAGRVASLEPLAPGVRQIELVYAVSNPPPQLAIEKRFQYPTRKFSVMVPEFGMRLPSPTDLQYEGAVGEDIGNRVHLASKGDLPAGGRVSFVVSRDVESSYVETVFLGVAAVVVLGLAIPFAIRRRRLSKTAPPKGKPSVRATASVDGSQRPQSGLVPVTPAGGGATEVKSFADERSEILRKIASLDDVWEAGKIAKEEYERQRTELKARALEMARNSEKQ